MYKHIELYVNQYSIDLGKEGKNAIDKLFRIAKDRGVIPAFTENIYV